MRLCLAIGLIVFTIGLNIWYAENPASGVRAKGKLLTSETELPEAAVRTAQALEMLPRNPSLKDFHELLEFAGLGITSDWYKDSTHLWYFDSNFCRTTSATERAYVVSVSYWISENSVFPGSSVRIWDAVIYRLPSDAGSREKLWQIDYTR